MKYLVLFQKNGIHYARTVEAQNTHEAIVKAIAELKEQGIIVSNDNIITITTIGV